MDPDEIFTTLKDHAETIQKAEANMLRLWDAVHGPTNGEPDEENVPNPESVEARLQRLENRLDNLINKMAWAVKNT